MRRRKACTPTIIYGSRSDSSTLGVLLSDPKNKEEKRTSLKVEDVMVKEVVTIDDESTVKEAADVMNKFEIGCLITVKKGKAMGIVTERDLLKRVVAESKDPIKTRVKEIMTSPLVVTEPNMDVGEAVKLMFQMKIKKLPVVDGKKLVGLVTLTDIARFQPEIILILRQLAEKQAAPKSMQKIIDRYVV